MTAKTESPSIENRLEALEEQLNRVQSLLVGLSQQLESQQVDTAKATESIQHWVTDYVSIRLQQLVPETCEHPPELEVSDGPHLPGTAVPCTEEVVHRVARIPIPFVRQMVVQKVAQQAQQAGIARIDVTFFEEAATFWQCKLPGEDLLSWQHWQQHVLDGPKLFDAPSA